MRTIWLASPRRSGRNTWPFPGGSRKTSSTACRIELMDRISWIEKASLQIFPQRGLFRNMDRQERFCAFKSKKHNPYKEHPEFFKKEKNPSKPCGSEEFIWQGVTIPNPGSIKALRRNGYKTQSHLSHRFSGLFHYKIMPEPIWQKQIGIKTYESASSPDGATFPSIISTTI